MNCLQIPGEIIKQIDSLQRDFCWGFTEKRDTYVTSWKKLGLHKDLGGQGFRDLKILNKALLVKATWRICINPDEPWVKALQAKYFPYTFILHASFKTNCSWAWKGLQKQITFIKANSRWRVGTCTKIKIWLDVWIMGMTEPAVPRHGVEHSEDYIWV